MNSLKEQTKEDLLNEIDKRLEDGAIETKNAELLKKLIVKADSFDEALMIKQLGTLWCKTGIQFERDFEKEILTDTIHYLKKNDKLSFHTDNKKDAVTHKLIVGDNFVALKNLLIQYRGKVDVIYIDPPYGKDSMGEFAATNYDNAISRDNLLTMLELRLNVAKWLLSDTGVIFCSIDDRNQAYVKCLFDEIFGERNFVTCVPRLTKKQRASQEMYMDISHDYILCYAYKKEFDHIMERNISESSKICEDSIGKYIVGDTKALLAADSQGYSKNGDYDYLYNGKIYKPIDKNGNRNRWLWTKERMDEAAKLGILVETANSLRMQLYLDKRFDEKTNMMVEKSSKMIFHTADFMLDSRYSNASGSNELKKIGEDLFKEFSNPKSIALLKDLLKMASSTSSIVLDFFAGSGTTGQAVAELNKEDGGKRQFILVQMNEKTATTPNGIVNDVTSKRLKRVMTGECYDGNKDFDWIKKNSPLGGNLDVYDIKQVSSKNYKNGEAGFDVIDETLYGVEKFKTFKEKVDWVCDNFEITLTTTDKEN